MRKRRPGVNKNGKEKFKLIRIETERSRKYRNFKTNYGETTP
jgi:hypothetical protein